MVADVAGGVYNAQAAQLYAAAAAVLDASGNPTDSSRALVKEALAMIENARTCIVARSVNNALTLIVMTIAFIAILSCSVIIFRSVERLGAKALLMSAMNSGKAQTSSDINTYRIVADTVDAAAEQRRHLTWACSLVLLTCPPCAGYYLLFAYANFNQVKSDCGGVCDPCQPIQFLVRKWMDATPEFWTLVCSVSSPTTLAICIWIVTKAHARAVAISADMRKVGSSIL